MKKHITILFVLIISAFSFAQKIKEKKDQLFFDKTAVANFTKEKSIFTLSKLDNTESFTIEVVYCALSEKFYLEFVNTTTQSKNQKVLIKFSAFNQSKYVALVLEEAGFVTSEGIQVEKLNAFINGEKFDLATEYGCTLINEGRNKITDLNIKVLKNGVITKGNNLEIGRVTVSVSLDIVKYEDYTYRYFNDSKELIATVTGKMVSNNVVGTLKTFDNKSYKIPLEKYFSSFHSFEKDKNVEMLMLILAQNGYDL